MAISHPGTFLKSHAFLPNKSTKSTNESIIPWTMPHEVSKKLTFLSSLTSFLAGDGSAMASRAGLPMQDLEFVQFHPTGADIFRHVMSSKNPAFHKEIRNSEIQ